MSLLGLHEEAAPKKPPGPPCVICGEPADGILWGNLDACFAHRAAWFLDDRFKAGNMGILLSVAPGMVPVEEACRRYESATAAWVEEVVRAPAGAVAHG